MAIEIERKFLVKNTDYKAESYAKNYIKQGYLNADKNRTVRVRITDKKGFITIKGASNASGLSRFEWEKEIALEDANNLLTLCENTCIEKNRFLVKNGKHIFEVDEFLGDNIGLVIAEIELDTETEAFNSPSWLGKDVTGQLKYYNSNISKHPFKNW